MTFFDTANETESTGFEPLPAGVYRVMLDNSESKVSQKGDPYISLKMIALDEPHKGRFIFHNFNIQSSSEQARKIARAQFKSLLTALGHTTALEYENDFHRLVMANPVIEIDVGQRVDTRNGNMQNTVKSFAPKKAMGSTSASPSRTSMTSSTSQQGSNQARRSPVAVNQNQQAPWSDDEVPPF